MNPSAFAPRRVRLRNSGAGRRRSLISLTPLIDVVFILLIFFMLATSFLDWRAIALDSPAKAGGGTSMEGALLVRIMADGGLDFGGESVSPETLQLRLRARLAANPGRRILVKPDEGVALQRMVTVLDGVAAAGGTNVSVIRDPGR